MHQNHEDLHHVARDNLRDFIHKPVHNTNSDSIVLNIPEGFAEKAADTNDSGVATAVSVVYVTVAPSFTGSVLGYVTASADTDTASQTTAATTAASVTALSDSNSDAVTSSTVTYTPTVGTPVATSRSSTTTAATTANLQNSVQNSAAASTSSASSDTGLTAGAQAGLAIGIIAAIALVAGLFFFCFRRKKNNTHEELNEKSAYNQTRSSFFGTAAGKRASADSDRSFGTVHNTATAPRLSLRPVTQFLPVFGEKRKSGNLLAFNGPQMSEKPSGWDRRPQGENPFADSAAQNDRQANPFDEGDGRSVRSNGSDGASAPQTPTTVTAAAVGQAPGPRGPNNVHRVQLDFKPSMDDELELKSGQLVRMLHEYDDGWALCVRMDRSQQGVAPRTCLSKQPVKPRGPPPGGRISPPGNNMRGPPQGPGVARKPVPGQAI